MIEPKYNPKKDLQAVEQYGYVDLSDVFTTGVISGDLSFSPELYNGIEDPSSIIPRADDIFDLYRQTEYIKSASVEVNQPKDD